MTERPGNEPGNALFAETNLLGANVLRNYQVSQNDSSMLIGPR